MVLRPWARSQQPSAPTGTMAEPTDMENQYVGECSSQSAACLARQLTALQPSCSVSGMHQLCTGYLHVTFESMSAARVATLMYH